MHSRTNDGSQIKSKLLSKQSDFIFLKMREGGGCLKEKEFPKIKEINIFYHFKFIKLILYLSFLHRVKF